MERKRKILLLAAFTLCFIQGSGAHLLPQALEDVHAFVQAELNQGRSQGGSQIGIDTPPQGGPAFQTTQTYIGTPVTIQQEVFLDGKHGFQKFVDDLNIGSSQIVLDRTGPTSNGGDSGLPRGLVPPAPIITQQRTLQIQDAAESTQQAQVIPANLVGPSTFVSSAAEPQAQAQTVSTQIIQRNIQKQNSRRSEQPQSRPKKMDGWVPLDQEGTRIAKAVGAELQGESEPATTTVLDESVSYKNVGYSPKPSSNEVDADAGTTTVQVDNIIVGTNSNSATRKLTAKYPVYPGSSEKSHPKVVIHAQNVIIRDNLPETLEVNNSPAENSTTGNNIQQFQAYAKVPQLNNFLRDQLRIAAMNQLIQSQLSLQDQEPLPLSPPHPLSGKGFPRPLSLREIAQAARNGHFPPGLAEPHPSASSMMSFSIPHFVRMSPDARPLPSIQSQSKLPFPGGLGALYRNLLQNNGGGSSLFDPREPIDQSLLAALSGQRQKNPNFIPPPHFKSARPDYGDGVAYKFTETPEQPEAHQEEKQKPPQIQIVSAEPSIDRPPPPRGPPPPSGGSLSQISDDLLKQLIIEELDNSNSNPLLPSSNPFYGGRPQAPRGRRPSQPFPYGTNAHPFSFLNGGGPDSDIQESFNGYGSAGPSDTTSYIFEGDDEISYGGGPGGGGPPPGGDYESSSDDSEAGIMPLNKDTMMSLGKSLFHQALDFSKNHNPLTFIQRVRKLPPVKFELYKMPVGIPEGMVNKLSGKQRGPPSHGPPSYDGPPSHGPPSSYRTLNYGPPPRSGGGKKKHYTRKYRF